MLELCPHGHESYPFFCYLFLQRLPREICVLLAEEDATNMRAIPEKADRNLAIHAPQAHDTMVAALPAGSESEKDCVAAATANKGKQKHKKPVKKAGRRRSISPSTRRPALCFYHFRLGEKARHCKEPCTWSGNE
jgi:hypothetical protein